jgi:MFS superfamily sulfate permease-like transporter
MLGIFFASSHILPYVPTITASTLTFFIGMDLLLKALWDSSSCLIWDEWITVVATTLACSVIGFAPGIGIGVALVVCFQFLRTAIQTVSRKDA